MDQILVLIFLVTVLIALLPFFKKALKKREFLKTIEKIPGPKAYPLLGTTLPYIMKPREGTYVQNNKYFLVMTCFKNEK